MNLVEIYRDEKKPEENKKDFSTGFTAKSLVDKFSIFASIASNISIIRKDIAKLVRMQGIKPATKAESFFSIQKEKENVYESKLQKIKSTSPTQVGAKPKEENKKGIFDFISIKGIFDSILGFLPTIFKGLLAAGIIGQFLKDPEIFKIVKEFATGVLIKFFNGVTASFNLLSELFNNEDVQESIRTAINSIISSIGNFLNIKLTKLFDTPFGEVNLTIGGAIATVIGGFVAFKAAIATLTTAVLQAAGRIAMGGAGAGAAGAAGAAGVVGRVVKFVKKVGPVALLGGVLYYINEKGEGTPAPEGTPIPPGTPEVSANDVQPVSGVGSEVQTTPEVVKPPVSDTTKTVVNTAIAAGGAFTAYQASKAVKDVSGLAAKTGEAILDARTQSVGQLANSTQTTKWGRFLAYVAKKDNKLWSKVARKLAQSATLMTIPFAGWIAAAANLGFTVFTAYQLLVLWKEFNNVDTEESKDASSEPEQILSPEETNVTPQATITPTPAATPAPAPKPTAADMRQGRGYNRAEPTGTSPTPASSQTKLGANIKLNDEQKKMASLIFDRFKQAGFTDEQANAAIVNAYAESSLNPKAQNVTKKEASYGLFQMNTKGGLGTGHDPEKLIDPNYNITLAIDAAKKSKKFVASKSLDEAIRAFTIEVERPANMMTEAEKRVSIASSILGTQASPTTLASAPTSPTAGPPTAMAAAPTGGQKVMAASADFSDYMRQVLQPVVNVNAPTTNVQQAAAPRTQQAYSQPSVVDSEFMKLLVGRTVTI